MDRTAIGASGGAADEGFVQIGTQLKNRVKDYQVAEDQRRFRPYIYWYISFRCNLSCAHCSVNSSPWVDTTEDLTPEECMGVVDQMADLGAGAALLTGGEFLIRPDALDIMRALADRDIGIGLESNGLHFPRGFVELAKDLQSRNLLSMTVSLDGGTKETHERLRGPRSFDRTTRSLRKLKEAGVWFHIQCVLNAANYHTIPDVYALAQELSPECNVVQWATLNPVGRGVGLIQTLGLQPEHIPQVFASIAKAKDTYDRFTVIKVPPAIVPPKYLPLVLKKDSRVQPSTTCQFPLLGVLPNGDVTICALSRDNEDLHFGNLREDGTSLKSIWQKTRMDMLRSTYVAAEDLEGICGDCVWKWNCKGACRAWAYEEGDSFAAPFPICKSLDDAGAFPKVYKLSHQNEAAVKAYRQMAAGGCGCST